MTDFAAIRSQLIVAIGFYVTRGPRERAAARNLAMEEL